jgi:hypothetical protein
MSDKLNKFHAIVFTEKDTTAIPKAEEEAVR